MKSEPALVDVAGLNRRLLSQQHLIYKLKAIRALWMTAHNTPQSVTRMEREFMFLVGELLEGVPVENLQLVNISKKAFLREFSDSQKDAGSVHATRRRRK